MHTWSHFFTGLRHPHCHFAFSSGGIIFTFVRSKILNVVQIPWNSRGTVWSSSVPAHGVCSHLYGTLGSPVDRALVRAGGQNGCAERMRQLASAAFHTASEPRKQLFEVEHTSCLNFIPAAGILDLCKFLMISWHSIGSCRQLVVVWCQGDSDTDHLASRTDSCCQRLHTSPGFLPEGVCASSQCRYRQRETQG